MALKQYTPTKLSPKQKSFLDILEKRAGNITLAARANHMDRATYYNWMANSPVFKKAVEEVKEGLLDFVESMAMSEIKKGNTAMIIFYLKTQGKKRGYIESTEQILTARAPAQQDISEVTDEEAVMGYLEMIKK